ncbi:MAG: hypothetical protein EHM23_09475 [Acidobacteria bacterium]|nr:MAG: hypothetical protein EHM23_09475 [Acidobacteriota bacterium]
MKTNTVFITILLVALSLLVGNGCTGNQETSAVTTQPGVRTVGKQAAGQAGGGAPTVTTAPGNIKISGSQSGSVKVPAEQGGYLIKYRHKGFGLKLELNSPMGPMNMVPGGQYAGSDGWAVFEDLTSFREAGEQQYQITATEPFEIQFVKLPGDDAPDAPPKTYSGNGLKVVGPFSLKAGSASFKVNCPDLKQAGFVAELYDATTGQNKGMIALGTSASVAETKKLQVPSAGDYLVKVNANGRAEWTIEVSQ